MSSYHGKRRKNQQRSTSVEDRLPASVEVSLEDLAQQVREGLLAFSVAIGLQVMERMMAEEVTALVGPKGKHQPGRTAVRHGKEDGQVVLGGRKVAVKRPRVRTTDGQEVALESYQRFQDPALLGAAALERMLHGLSCRRYGHGLEPVGQNLEPIGTSKSAVDRRFIAQTRQALEEVMKRPLSGHRYPVLMLDGIEMGEHTVIVALGADGVGQKHLLGLWEGATENAAVCKALLADLVDRGLDTSEGILVVIDGSKALESAVKKTWGRQAVIQRCQVHKKRNVLDHLPEQQRPLVSRQLDRAWREPDAEVALDKLKKLAATLKTEHPGASASILEGLEETLTVNRLGLPPRLARSLRSTNAIESLNASIRDASRNVKRWRNGEQALRWAAAASLDAEKRLRRLYGYRDMPILIAALRRIVLPESSITAKTA
jgi:transposase-like protein